VDDAGHDERPKAAAAGERLVLEPARKVERVAQSEQGRVAEHDHAAGPAVLLEQSEERRFGRVRQRVALRDEALGALEHRQVRRVLGEEGVVERKEGRAAQSVSVLRSRLGMSSVRDDVGRGSRGGRREPQRSSVWNREDRPAIDRCAWCTPSARSSR
jgi:hypothetical protein